MARLGFDSLEPVKKAKINAATQIGAPVFWGRYFHAPGQKNSSGHVDSGHYSAAENKILRQNNCRLLPIARQTNLVGGTKAKGAAHAALNVAALFEAIPPSFLHAADPDVIMMLDIEPGGDVSAAYWTGWSAALMAKSQELSGGTVTVNPGIYLNSKSNGASVEAINTAIAGGATCAGMWVARYPLHKACSDVPDFQQQIKFLTPATPTSVPILAWQCRSAADNGCDGFDLTVINDDHADIFIDRLILTPLT
jgi:hypothetical protein